MARLVTLIEAEITRGAGTFDDPVRSVTQWFTITGELLFERDFYSPTQAREVHFPNLGADVDVTDMTLKPRVSNA